MVPMGPTPRQVIADTMSVFRLILGIASLAISLLWFEVRSRRRSEPERPNQMHPRAQSLVAWAWIVIGILWLIAAFV